MSSYLNQFNYQFLSGGGRRWTLDEVRSAGNEVRRWVFLHGLMGYAVNWRKVTTLLGPNDLSLIFDQRGHGQSMQPPTGYAPENYAEDLCQIATEIGWSGFLLVGHSMGGRNAQCFAARFPEFVQGLVIEDIGPDGNPRADVYYRELLEAVPTPFPNKLRAKEFFMNDFRKLPVRGNAETIGLYFYSNIVDQPDGTADWRFSKEAILASVREGRAQDRWEEYHSLKMPVLVIRGAESAELSPEVFARMQVENPNAHCVEVPNAGHWVHYDQPERFVELLKSFADHEVF